MKFNKEEIKNILNMLLSEDEENRTLAFECIENHFKKENIADLLVLYQFSKVPSYVWEKNCKKGYKYLKKVLNIDNKNYRIPSSILFEKLLDIKTSEEIIELYLELFTKQFSENLYSLGYPVNKFDIQIKIKDYGQTTKS